eukprot:1730575-Lingulodinium_polyedra.AAC.1
MPGPSFRTHGMTKMAASGKADKGRKNCLGSWLALKRNAILCWHLKSSFQTTWEARCSEPLDLQALSMTKSAVGVLLFWAAGLYQQGEAE